MDLAEAMEWVHSRDFDLEASLGQLDPLPIPHHSFGANLTWISDSPPEQLRQYVRVFRTFDIDAADLQEARIRKQVQACEEAGGVLGITFQPWHAVVRKYKLDRPPVPGSTPWAEELGYLRRCCEAVLHIVDGRVPITRAVLDCEVWRKLDSNGDPADSAYKWDMLEALDGYDAALRGLLPGVAPTWFGRGWAFWGPAFRIIHWPYWTGREETTCLCPYLYTVGNYHETVRLYRANQAAAKPLVPYVALGAGYPRPFADGTSPIWHWEWDYDLTASYLLGRFLRMEAPEAVVFYPRAFHPKAPYWNRHFMAYAAGWQAADEHLQGIAK